jgi:hypothetical protein
LFGLAPLPPEPPAFPWPDMPEPTLETTVSL